MQSHSSRYQGVEDQMTERSDARQMAERQTDKQTDAMQKRDDAPQSRRDYQDVTGWRGGRVRVWLDGEIEVLEDHPDVAGFKAAADRLAKADAAAESETRREESDLDYAIANFVRMPPDATITAAEVADMLSEMADDLSVRPTPKGIDLLNRGGEGPK
jgi:hypothetical protein